MQKFFDAKDAKGALKMVSFFNKFQASGCNFFIQKVSAAGGFL